MAEHSQACLAQHQLPSHEIAAIADLHLNHVQQVGYGTHPLSLRTSRYGSLTTLVLGGEVGRVEHG